MARWVDVRLIPEQQQQAINALRAAFGPLTLSIDSTVRAAAPEVEFQLEGLREASVRSTLEAAGVSVLAIHERLGAPMGRRMDGVGTAQWDPGTSPVKRAEALAPLADALDAAGVSGGRPAEYVLIGGAVMYLHGLRSWRSLGDVDMMLWPGAYSSLRSRGWEETWPRAGDPPMLRGEVGLGIPVHAWERWNDRHPISGGADLCRLALDAAKPVGGWLCQPLEQLLEWKEAVLDYDERSAEAGREKDRTDATLIRALLAHRRRFDRPG